MKRSILLLPDPLNDSVEHCQTIRLHGGLKGTILSSWSRALSVSVTGRAVRARQEQLEYIIAKSVSRRKPYLWPARTRSVTTTSRDRERPNLCFWVPKLGAYLGLPVIRARSPMC